MSVVAGETTSEPLVAFKVSPESCSPDDASTVFSLVVKMMLPCKRDSSSVEKENLPSTSVRVEISPESKTPSSSKSINTVALDSGPL